MLGRVYEYFLSNFAAQEGKNGGAFYTPRSIVRTLVEMLEPYKGRIYDRITMYMIHLQSADKRLILGVLERVA